MIDPEGFNELKSCRSGPMLYNKRDWPIGMSLAKYGEFSWQETEVFRQLVKPGSLIVDAGANIGVHTVEFSKLAGCVVAFEPQRIAFQTLCANLMLNQCTNVRAVNAALGERDDYIPVPVFDQYAINNLGGVRLAGVTEGEATQLMRLDRIEFQRLDFIKADLEGMEPHMLAGAERTISRHRPQIYLEVDDEAGKETIRIMLSLKYDCYWHFPRIFNPNNAAGITENIFGDEGKEIVSINMICFPSEINARISGFRRILSPEDVGIAVENAQITKKTVEAAFV